MIWNGLTLWGKHSDPDDCAPSVPDKKASVDILIKQPSASSTLDTGMMWIPSIMVEDCLTGIKVEGTHGGCSCAFGFCYVKDCDVGVHIDGAKATMFTFQYIHPLGTGNVFKVTNGAGRIFVQSVNTVNGVNEVLDVDGAVDETAFFHINGVSGDNGNSAYHLLQNDDDGNGLTHVRYTNCIFTSSGTNSTSINIDRSKIGGGSTGQTVCETVGSRGFAGSALIEEVVIYGASSSQKSHLFVRDCELNRNSELIDPNASPAAEHYTIERVKNWMLHSGLQIDKSESD